MWFIPAPSDHGTLRAWFKIFQICMISFTAKHKRRYFVECWQPNSFDYHWLPLYDTHTHTKNTNTETFLKKSKSYKFGMTWGWVNGWTIPLNTLLSVRSWVNMCNYNSKSTWQAFIVSKIKVYQSWIYKFLHQKPL